MRICFTILYLLMIGIVFSQEIPDDNLEKHLEDVAEKSEQDIVEDSYLEEMQQYQRHRLNLNTVTEEELNQLRILTAIQIKNLINYRSLLGKLISVYELQAVPGWDIPLIKKLLSYITATDQPFSVETFSKQLKSGEHSLMFRLSRALEKPGAYKDTGSSKFIGSPQGLLVRYRYNYKNLLQFGLVAEKDAGEPLFKGHGFDFYSFYFFIRNP